jgi:hypothetical protein
MRRVENMLMVSSQTEAGLPSLQTPLLAGAEAPRKFSVNI